MRHLPLLLLSFRISAMASATEFHVSPSGDDAGDGSAERPFATPSRARDALRLLKSESGLPEAGASVWLHGGDYRLRESFLLERQDSGAPGAPIAYRPAPGAQPRLLGGIELPAAAWAAVEDPVVRGKLSGEAREEVRRIDLGGLGVPAVAPPPDAFKGSVLPELFAGGERMPLARWPNEGWVTFTEAVDRGSRSGDEVPRGGTFRYEEERPARWSVEEGSLVAGVLVLGLVRGVDPSRSDRHRRPGRSPSPLRTGTASAWIPDTPGTTRRGATLPSTCFPSSIAPGNGTSTPRPWSSTSGLPRASKRRR